MLSLAQVTAFAAQGYNRIPLALQLLADLETPLSVYCKLANQPYSYLFESVHGGERWGRYSIIGLSSAHRLEVRAHQVRVYQDETIVLEKQVADPLAFIQDYQAQFKVPMFEGLPRFTGGLVGYFAYDTVRLFEKKLAATIQPDPLDVPDIPMLMSKVKRVCSSLPKNCKTIINYPSNLMHPL